MFSSVTGAVVGPDTFSGAYWVRNLVAPVRFTDALCSTRHEISEKGSSSPMVLIEVGPHPALQSAIRDTMGTEIFYKGLLTRQDSGLDTMLNAVGELSCEGVPVDILKVNEAATPTSYESNMFVDLPICPFNHHERLIFEDRLSRNSRLSRFPRHSLFGAPVADWNPHCPRWRYILNVYEDPWLTGHVASLSLT
jgi:acyl transferase domain-containing protein